MRDSIKWTLEAKYNSNYQNNTFKKIILNVTVCDKK